MKIKYFLQLITLFFILFVGANFSAQANIGENRARTWAQGKGEEILQILTSQDTEAKYNKLDQILTQDADLDYIAKFIMGKYWRLMTAEQQENYRQLFDRYIHAVYKSYPLDLQQGDVTFQIDKIISNANDTEVLCTIFIKNLEKVVDEKSAGGIKVIFRLVENGGKIQLRDLKIGESSLLLSFRNRFYKMIHEDSDDEIEWFLEDFATMIDDLEEKNEKMYSEP